MKWLDLPPLWTALALAVTWIVPLEAAWSALPATGYAMIALASLLMALAVRELARARTTVMPHQEASALVTTGVFRFSRNPIYLADLLILAGASLIWGRPLGLLLVPLLAVILTRRFIAPEEARLAASFPPEWRGYEASVRRWI